MLASAARRYDLRRWRQRRINALSRLLLPEERQHQATRQRQSDIVSGIGVIMGIAATRRVASRINGK